MATHTHASVVHARARALFIFIPLAIFALQLLSRVNGLALCGAGVLTALKALLEWKQLQTVRASTTGPLVRRIPPTVAGCYLCQQVRPLHTYEIDGLQIAVCPPCQHWVSMSGRASKLARVPVLQLRDHRSPKW